MKKSVPYLKRIIAAVIVPVIFFKTWCGLRYLVTDDANSYTRVMMHEFYTQDNIDVLFCGASLCYRSFDTAIFDGALGLNTFNAGSSTQDIDVTYHIIEEAVHKYNIKHIILELSPIMAQNINIDSRTASGMAGVYIISDYMKWSPNKIQLLLNASPPDLYINSFLAARRNWKNIQDMDYIRNLLAKKSTSSYREYQYGQLQHDTEWYAGKGYVKSNIQIEDETYRDAYTSQKLEVEKISEDWHLYLNKIINCCKKNQVELTLACTPLSMMLLSCYGEQYDEYHNMISQIAYDAGIEFWDFSLCKEKYLPLNPGCYCDSAHLNMYGAEIFSKLVAEILAEGKSVDEMCYENTVKKLQEWTIPK